MQDANGPYTSPSASAPPATLLNCPLDGEETNLARGGGLDSDVELMASEAGAPSTFFCPISLKLLRDPVMLPTGHTYERRYLERWLAQARYKCPITGEQLPSNVTLVPNVALRKCIEEWAENHAPGCLGPDGHLRPIPEQEDFSSVSPAQDADMALAIRLQEEELARASLRHEPGAPSGTMQQWSHEANGPMRHHRRSANRPPRLGGGSRSSRRARRICSLRSATIPLQLISFAILGTFIAAFQRSSWELETLLANPLVGPSAEGLCGVGALCPGSVRGGGRQYWRLITSAFVCAGLIQEFLAVSCLWVFGRHLEPVLRCPLLTVPLIHALSAALGALAASNLVPQYEATGASAGVTGLLGGVWVNQLLHWRKYTNHLITLGTLLSTTTVFVFMGCLPLVSNFVQVPALLAGALLTVCFFRPQQGTSQRGGRKQKKLLGAQLLCGLLLAAALGLGALGLARDSLSCSWCRRAACIDSRWWDCGSGVQRTQPLQPACQVLQNSNGTSTVQCPTGVTRLVSVPGDVSTAQHDELCRSFCSLGPSAGAPALTLTPLATLPPPPSNPPSGDVRL